MTTAEMFPETVDVMTRYGYTDDKALIPVGPAIMEWLHLSYAAGNSLDALRTILRSRNFNDFEIGLILEYIDTYVRTEMGINPDNSRSEQEQGVVTRCNKFRNKAKEDLANYIAWHQTFKSAVVAGATFRVSTETAAQWQALLTGTWATVSLPGLGNYDAPVTRDEVIKLIAECTDAVIQVSTAQKEIEAELDQLYSDLDIIALTRYDVVATLQTKLPWLE